MHRIDALDHVDNMFDEGDPAIPRPPTQIDKHWLNGVQEAIVNPILQAGLTLTKGVHTQLIDALRILLVNLTTNQTVSGVKTWASNAIFQAGLEVDHPSDIAATVTSGGAGAALSVQGNGAGVAAVCPDGTDGTAVLATADQGYAVVAQTGTTTNTRAAFRLVPQSAPTVGLVGDMYMSTAGVLRVCTVAGSPGTWVVVGSQS